MLELIEENAYKGFCFILCVYTDWRPSEKQKKLRKNDDFYCLGENRLATPHSVTSHAGTLGNFSSARCSLYILRSYHGQTVAECIIHGYDEYVNQIGFGKHAAILKYLKFTQDSPEPHHGRQSMGIQQIFRTP